MKTATPTRFRFLTILCLMALVTGVLLWWLGRDEEAAGPDTAMRSKEEREAPSTRQSQSDGRAEPSPAKADARTAPAEPEDAGTLTATPEPRVKKTRIISSSGRITTAAMEELGLTEDEADALRKITRKVMAEAVADAAKRTKVVEREAAEGTRNYYLPAREDGGQAYRDRLAQEFESVVGRERSQSLIEGLKQLDCAGGLGRYGMKLSVNASGFVKYETPMVKGECAPDYFREQFGAIIELPEKLGFAE